MSAPLKVFQILLQLIPQQSITAALQRAIAGEISANYMVVCQNLVPLVNIKIAGKWMFIPLKMVCIGIDP